MFFFSLAINLIGTHNFKKDDKFDRAPDKFDID